MGDDYMNKVSNIITTKDLDYLSDMFEWNYGVYKSTINSVKCINDEEIKQTLARGSELFLNNMYQVLNVLKEANNE